MRLFTASLSSTMYSCSLCKETQNLRLFMPISHSRIRYFDRSNRVAFCAMSKAADLVERLIDKVDAWSPNASSASASSQPPPSEQKATVNGSSVASSEQQHVHSADCAHGAAGAGGGQEAPASQPAQAEERPTIDAIKKALRHQLTFNAPLR